MNKLNDKQEAFCREYLVDLNATQAAIRAGYSERSARETASRMLTKANIQQRVVELKEQRNERTQIDQDYVLLQAQKIHERCMQEVRPLLDRKGEQVTDDEGNALYVFDAAGATRSLELIGKHVSVQAFREKIDMDARVASRVESSVLNNVPVEKLKQIKELIEDE